MSILHIVLSALIILILFSTLSVFIYKCGINGISCFIIVVIFEGVITPIFAYLVQIFLNFYNFLITGNRFGYGNGDLIMYSPITVLLIVGLIISFFILLLCLSWNKYEF